MKEQVSVDTIDATLSRLGHRDKTVKMAVMPLEEYERLKRLDENVKKLINDLTYSVNSNDGKTYILNKPMLPIGLMNIPLDDIKQLLESLYE